MYPEGEWRITVDASDQEAYAVLAQDQIWNCFAIADLSPPFREFTRVAVAEHEDDAVTATVMVLESPYLCVTIPSGDAQGCSILLDSMPLPERTFIQTMPGLLPVIDARYRPSQEWARLLRMAVDSVSFRPSSDNGHILTERLGERNTSELHELYGSTAGGGFPDVELKHGVFFGIRVNGSIVSVAGTHAVSQRHGIGILGGVLTREDHRRRGCARILTSRLTQELFELGCSKVTLNVLSGNTPAILLYGNLGFAVHASFVTADAIRRS